MTPGTPTLPVMRWNSVSIDVGRFARVLGGLPAPAGITVLVADRAARIGSRAGPPVPAEAAEVAR